MFDFSGSSDIFYLLGQGKVGSALKKYFEKNNIPLENFDIDSNKKEGVLFLAVPDDIVSDLQRKISQKFSKITIIHFSAASDDENMHLLHPYCSIASDTSLENIFFTLWTKTPEKIIDKLNKSGLKFVHAGTTPSPLYHASAVISGNFSQFFSLTALELLEKEGFSRGSALKLIDQLMTSSLKNITAGLKGITGPASRGDIKTVDAETEALKTIDQDLSSIFKNINSMIIKALEDGTILKK